MATSPPGNFLQPLGSLFGMNAPQAPQTQIVPDETIQDIMKMANALRQKPDKVHGPYGALGTVIGALRGNQMAEQADAIRRGNADIKLGQQPYFGPGGPPGQQPPDQPPEVKPRPMASGGEAMADASGVIPGFTGGNLAPYKRAIAGNESGGNYDAVGPQTKHGRAYGKYQVLESNVGPWTKEFLGQEMTPEEFRQNPEAQEKVFEGKFGQYKQQYGDQGAAQAWFGGPGGVGKNVNDGYHDSNWYTSNFNRSMGSGSQVASAGDQLPRGAVPASAAGGTRPALPGIIAALQQGAQGAAQGGAAPPGAGEGLGQQFAASAGARGPAGSSAPAVQAGGAESAGWSNLPRNMWVPEQSIPHYPPASRAQLQGLILQGYSPDQVQQFALRGQTPYPIRTVPGQGQIMYDPKTRQQFWQGDITKDEESLGEGVKRSVTKMFNPDGTAKIIGETPEEPASRGTLETIRPPMPTKGPDDFVPNVVNKAESIPDPSPMPKTPKFHGSSAESFMDSRRQYDSWQTGHKEAQVRSSKALYDPNGIREIGQKSADMLPQLDVMEQLLRDSRTPVGSTAEFKAKVGNLANSLKNNFKIDLGFKDWSDDASKYEVLKKMSKALVLESLRPFLGSGAGQFRVAEIDIITDALARPDLTRKGNLAVLALMRGVAEQAQKKAQMYQTFAERNGGIIDNRIDGAVSGWQKEHGLLDEDKKKQFFAQLDAPEEEITGSPVVAPSSNPFARAPKDYKPEIRR